MLHGDSLVEWVLGRYLFKEDLQDILEDLDLPVSGTKDELIYRTMTDRQFDPGEALAFLDKEQLQMVAEDAELDWHGTRPQLTSRLLRAMSD